MKRRTFIGGVAAGSAVIAMPAFLAGCGEKTAISPTTVATPINPFMDWFGVDQQTISTVMQKLTARGADTAELFFEHARINSLAMEDGIVSRASSSIQQGVGLRVVIGDQTGYAFTEDLTLDSMLKAAGTAAAIAQGNAAVVPQAYNPKDMGGRYTTTVPWEDVGVDAKLPILRNVDTKVRAAEPAVSKVNVSMVDGDNRVLIATLDGQMIMDHRPMTRMFAAVTATKDGVTQSNAANIAARQDIAWYTEERLDQLAKDAVDRTMILFDARRPPAGEMPVVLAAGASGILLHEAIGHGMEADFNRKGRSIYSDMIGKKVAEPFVTIIDSGAIPNARGALNYDDEGNACNEIVMVEDGILKSYLHDTISSRQYGLAPTGSGRRESYKHEPMPRMTCTYMANGPHTRDEIVASMDHGIIAETYTNGQVQIGEGDYTFYVKNGWLVEGGKVTAPIKDVNIIGNGPESLTRISMVANDAEMDTGGWTCGKNGQSVPVSLGMPSVLVSRMTVGGQNA